MRMYAYLKDISKMKDEMKNVSKLMFSMRNPPADEYNIPGYNLVRRKASLLH
jgi:hypothetical protein